MLGEFFDYEKEKTIKLGLENFPDLIGQVLEKIDVKFYTEHKSNPFKKGFQDCLNNYKKNKKEIVILRKYKNIISHDAYIYGYRTGVFVFSNFFYKELLKKGNENYEI